MTRVYKSALLSEATRVQVLARDDEANQLEAIVNGELYLLERHGDGRYTVTKEEPGIPRPYTVVLDDFDSSCTCKGFTMKRRQVACCRHLVACAVLRRDAEVLAGFCCREVK